MSNTETPEKEVSREEVVAWYKEQIELATLRADLAEQQNRAAKNDAERLQATMFMAQVQQQQNAPADQEQESPKVRPLKTEK
jgi:hypothetical protein